MTSIEDRFAGLSTADAPGQEGRRAASDLEWLMRRPLMIAIRC